MNRLLLVALFISSAGQAQWSTIQGPMGLTCVYFTDSTNGWVGGTLGIYYTTDAGDNWVQQAPRYVCHLAGVSTGNCWATGLKDTLYHTLDTGRTWHAMTMASTLDSIHALGRACFTDSLHGWVPATRRGLTWVLRTTDAGATWSASHVDSTEGGSPICTFVDSQRGWVTGGSADINRTTDGGATWTLIGYAPIGVYDMRFLTEEIGWAIVQVGTQYAGLSRTVDGGRHFLDLPYLGCDVSSCFFTDTLQGWVVLYCSPMRIMHTTDGGQTWASQLSPTTNPYMSAVHFVDTLHGWVTTLFGTVFRTTNGGVTAAASPSDKLPGVFRLLQNYPNPFNGETSIRFSLPHAEMVELVVYDLLGRTIATLVDEVLLAGDHHSVFNAANLASGVYLARLKAGAFIRSVPLVVLR